MDADFITDGKLFDNVAFAANQIQTSKSVKTDSDGIKDLYVVADQTGSFVVQLLMDENENVWRTLDTLPTSFPITANLLFNYHTENLFKQFRIVYTNGATPATVNAWFFSPL